MFTDLKILPKFKSTVTRYILLSSAVLVLSGCPSASNPSKPSSSSSPSAPSSSSSSSQTSSSGTTASMPNSGPGSQTMPSPAGGGAPSTEASQHSTGNGGSSGSFEEPWADIGDNSGDDYENTGAADIDIGSADNAGFEQEPDFSDTESVSGNGQTDVFSEYEQTSGTDGTYPGAVTTDAGPILTSREQVAVFDEQLNHGTAEFDDMILKEREAIRRSASGVFSDSEQTNTESNGDDYPGSIYDSGNSESSSETSGSASTPSVPGSKGGYSQTANTYSTPADIPQGNDDDVVARQLREAAMREPDPVLREKLWEEYRKYKGIKQ